MEGTLRIAYLTRAARALHRAAPPFSWSTVRAVCTRVDTAGNSTMAVDLSPPLLTGALVVFQMFFRSRDLSGLNIRAPSKPLWCDRAERLRTDRPRIIPPHDTGAQHAGGRRHAPRAGPLTPPVPRLQYFVPCTSNRV